MMKRIALIIFLSVLFSLGCGPRRMAPAVRPLVKQKQHKPKKLKSLVLKSSGNASFDILRPFFSRFIQKREGLVNPFKSNLAMFAPKVSVVVAETREQKKETPKTPLEYHDLSFYRLTAIISGIALPKALIVGQKGATYVIKLGTPIGNHGGRVTAITSDGVVVEEPGKAPITMKLIENTDEMAKIIESMYEY